MPRTPLTVDHPRPVRLKSIQKLVGEAIFRPLTADYRTQRTWTDGRPMQEVAGTVIKPNDRLSSLERLEIYNRQYWFRIIDSFHEDFPGLRAILGTARFQKIAIAYLAECPSKSFTLRNLGQFLVAFLEKHPRLTAPYSAMALDMARLEWAQIEAFDNASLPPVTLGDIQTTSPDKLRLNLQPHITLIAVSYAVDDYLLDVKKRVAKAGSDRIPVIRTRPKKQRGHIAVHRHNNSVYYKSLDPVAYFLLTAVSHGQTLAEAFTTAFESVSNAQIPTPELIREWFQSWTTFGWFCKAAAK